MEPIDDRGSRIRIDDIGTIVDMEQVTALETEVWGLEPYDVLPLTMLVATRAAGAILVGAFDGADLVGFVYGFPGIEDGRTTIHSHMLAVKPGYRDLDLGYRLKLAQRERAISIGVTEVTWTFDPLQSKNAHFNFGKLGVVANTYKIDFYGTASSSFLLRDSTDRLWVRWAVSSDRVRGRIETPTGGVDLASLEDAAVLVDADERGTPWATNDADRYLQTRALIYIPDDINALHAENATLAAQWRTATRDAFTRAFAAGFVAEAFARPDRGARRRGAYVLRRSSVEDLLCV